MRCATAAILIVAILQQFNFIHAHTSSDPDEFAAGWQKRLATEGNAATKVAEAGVKAAKGPLHISRTTAGAVTAGAAALGFTGGVAGHQYYSTKQKAARIGLGNEPPMKRDSIDNNDDTIDALSLNKRGNPVPVKKMMAIAGGAASGGALIGALGHATYSKDKERRKAIADAAAAESGAPVMKKRATWKGKPAVIGLGGVGVGAIGGIYGHKAYARNKAAGSAQMEEPVNGSGPGPTKRSILDQDKLPLEKRGKPIPPSRVAAIATTGLAAGVVTGIGAHGMLQDHNTVKQLRNGDLPMKRFEDERQSNMLQKRTATRSIFSSKAAGVIGAASFGSGAAIGGLGHKVITTSHQSLPNSAAAPGPIKREEEVENDGQLVRRDKGGSSLKALGTQAKKFLQTKHGRHVAGAVGMTGLAGASVGVGHLHGQNSERKRIQQFQSESAAGGSENGMTMVKRAGLSETLGHAGTSLKGAMNGLHGKVGKKGVIAIGAGAGATALAGISYATGHHQGKISKPDDHHQSMHSGAGESSSMMYKRGILAHPKTMAALTAGPGAALFAQYGSARGKLHEQRKLNGMDRHHTSSVGSSPGAGSVGVSGNGAEMPMRKREEGSFQHSPSSSEVETVVHQGTSKVQKPSASLTRSHSTPSSSSSSSFSNRVPTAAGHEARTAIDYAKNAKGEAGAMKSGESIAAKALKNSHITGKQAVLVGGALAATAGATALVHHATKTNKQKRDQNLASVESPSDIQLQKRSKGNLNKVLMGVGTASLGVGGYLAGYGTGKPAGISKAARFETNARNSGLGTNGGGIYRRAMIETEMEMAKREVVAKAASKAVMGVGAAGLAVGGFVLGRKNGRERGEAEYHTQKLQRGSSGGYYKRSFQESHMIKRGMPKSLSKQILLGAGAATIAAGVTVPAYKAGKKDGKHSARMARNSRLQEMSAPMDPSGGSTQFQKRDLQYSL